MGLFANKNTTSQPLVIPTSEIRVLSVLMFKLEGERSFTDGLLPGPLKEIGLLNLTDDYKFLKLSILSNSMALEDELLLKSEPLMEAAP